MSAIDSHGADRRDPDAPGPDVAAPWRQTAHDLLPTRDDDELTIAQVSEMCGVPISEVTREVRANRLPSRLVKGGRRGVRVIRRDVLAERQMIPEVVDPVVVEIAGQDVELLSETLSYAEVAVLLDGASVSEVAAMVGSGEIVGDEASARVEVGWMLDRLERSGDRLALILLAWIASGRLSIVAPPSDAEPAEGHIELFRRLSRGLIGDSDRQPLGQGRRCTGDIGPVWPFGGEGR